MEAVWKIIDEENFKIPTDKISAVAEKTIPCPLCGEVEGWARQVRQDLECSDGRTDSRDVPCVCGKYKTMCKQFRDNVSPHDWKISLSQLTASPKSQLPAKLQERLIAELQAEPTGSYAFFGPAGTSKTTFCVALYRAAVSRSVNRMWNRRDYRMECVWRVSAKTLLDEFVAESISKEAENGKPIEPKVNRNKIVRATKAGYRPCLFLEEIDKVKYTSFKINSLFEVIDAIYENNGQLVMNTNLPLGKFAAVFGDETGPALARRITEICKVYDLFPQAES